jgi:2,4-didehydro-3-deoxy-L-rhamnonate hydrolase
LGLVTGDRVVDITYTVEKLDRRIWPATPGDPLVAELAAVAAALPEQDQLAALESCALGDLALDCVLTSPTKVMAAPANYRRHVEIDTADPGVDQGVHRAQLDGLEHPVESLGLFLKATSSLAGPADGVRLHRLDRRTDYEVELAVVIGRTARHVAAADAFAHVAGYCVGLDMSIRGAEDRSFRKSGDTFTVLGPWLTTPEHIADPTDLTLRLSVNGVPRQAASTAAMTVGIPRLIELASAAYTLYPGDVLLTGTPEGVGPVEPGDVIVAGGDGLGEMTVPVTAASVPSGGVTDGGAR